MKKLIRAIAVLALLLFVAFSFLKKEDIPLEKLKAEYAGENSRFMQVDGLNVHYSVEGSGSPIVLIPGTGATLHTWAAWTDSLKKYHTVISLDMPAFGLTGPRADRDYSVQTYCRFLDKFLTQLGVDTFALGGNSLGGEIAWNYAALYPGKVSHLLLVDPGGFIEKNDVPRLSVFTIARVNWLARIINRLDTRWIVKKTLEDVFYNDSLITPEKIKLYYDMSMGPGNRQAFTDRVQLIGQEEHADIAAVKAKTLVMWGKEDLLIPVSQVKHYKNLPDAEVVIYDKIGHCPQEENPAQSVTDVLKFIHGNK